MLASLHVLSASRPPMQGDEPTSHTCCHALPTVMENVSSGTTKQYKFFLPDFAFVTAEEKRVTHSNLMS